MKSNMKKKKLKTVPVTVTLNDGESYTINIRKISWGQAQRIQEILKSDVPDEDAILEMMVESIEGFDAPEDVPIELYNALKEVDLITPLHGKVKSANSPIHGDLLSAKAVSSSASET